MEADKLDRYRVNDSFIGIVCAVPSCGKIMSVDATWESQLDQLGVQTTRPESQKVTCPYCSTESVYHPESLQRYRVTAKPEGEPR